MATIDAVFDGSVLRPVEPLNIAPNTRVRVTIEIVPSSVDETSFLDVAGSLNLEGPPDWATNLNEYLYGKASPDGD